jgi:hypothetical protein
MSSEPYHHLNGTIYNKGTVLMMGVKMSRNTARGKAT